MTPAVDRAPRAPERTCVGCRKTARREDVVRLVRDPAGGVGVDHPPRLGGRGAWVHARTACLARAFEKGGLSRSFAASIEGSSEAVAGDLKRRLEDRTAGMIAGGRGGARIAVGTEAAHEALDASQASLVLVASDAKGDREAIVGKAARAKVPAAVVLDKARLGRAVGKDVVGVLAVLDRGLAAALRREVSLLESLEGPDTTEATR